MNHPSQFLAEWTPSSQSPVFAGHFPGTPLLPGSMLLDWAVSAWANANQHSVADCSVRHARFLAPARPDVPLQLEQRTARRNRTRLQILAMPSDGEAYVVLDVLLDPPGHGGVEESP
ncbi:hypothetical protein D5687_04575 [Guyparkeria sp. SCN-R1]|uniref:hypothetical protein n=1 Tax=Guyparkeria sp. SCN-R1 TaxID=2341113 RepID=UPI000F648FCC|nr:hypothetical protein [Guyparkeria sp. SCN-R1]RRQ24013.1 hypothetical protein D5687_04575 [Guyparkeria sp. SCN-R1]